MRPIIVIVLVLSFLRGFCQSQEIDSLQHLVRTLPNDTTKVSILNKLTNKLRENDIAHALEFGIQAKQLAELIDFKHGKATALENLGWVYYRRGDYTKSFENTSEALKLFQLTGDWAGEGRCIIGIAGLRFEQQQYDAAVADFRAVLNISRAHGDTRLMARCLNNISFTLLTKGSIDSAAYYGQQGLRYSELIGDRYMVAAALRNYGDIEAARTNQHAALKHYAGALQIARKINNVFLEVSILPRMATAYEKIGEADIAIQYLQENAAKSAAHGYKDKLEWTYKLLSQAYAAQHDVFRALEYQTKYIAIHDSLYEQRSREQLALLQARFDSEMKEAKIELLTKDAQLKQDEIMHQRMWMYFYVTCVSFLLILAFVLLRRNHRRKRAHEALKTRNKQVQLQAQELRNLNVTKDKLLSIISHDLRTPLASLRALIELSHSGDLTAEEYMSVSRKLQRNLDSVNDDLDNLLMWAQSQLRGLQVIPEALYLRPVIDEKVNLFEESAKAKAIKVVNEIEEDLVVLADRNHVGLVIRNLLANAIKFNKHGGYVIIRQKEHDNMVEISVEDSGIGMSSADLGKLFNAETHFTNPGTNSEKGSGIGLILTREFIEKNGGTIWATSEPEKGSTFSFTLKREFVLQSRLVSGY